MEELLKELLPGITMIIGAWLGYIFSIRKKKHDKWVELKNKLALMLYEIKDIRVDIHYFYVQNDDKFIAAIDKESPDNMIESLAQKKLIVEFFELREKMRLFIEGKAKHHLGDELVNAIMEYLYSEEGHFEFIRRYHSEDRIDYKKFYRELTDRAIESKRNQSFKTAQKYLKV